MLTFLPIIPYQRSLHHPVTPPTCHSTTFPQHDEVEEYVPDDLSEPFESSYKHDEFKRHFAAD